MECKLDDHGKAQFLGISNALIGGMCDDELVAELERVKKEQRKFQSNLKGQPRYVRFIDENVREASCLASERRRIEREMRRRYENQTLAPHASAGVAKDLQHVGCALCPVTYHVQIEQALDAAEA